MVLAFFRSKDGDGDFDHIVAKSVSMLGDARHSFDLATLALLTDVDPAVVAADIRATDQRINEAEQELRSELVVHVSVRGAADIGSVLGFTLLLKKIERIGDQAKNILDLAEHGVNLASNDEITQLLAEREAASSLFTEASDLLASNEEDSTALEAFEERAQAMAEELQTKIDGFMTSDRPGREVVPLAIYYRYLRRIVANLLGVVRTSGESIAHVDYLDDGTVDTDD